MSSFTEIIPIADVKSFIRHDIRCRRRSLTSQQQTYAAQKVLDHILIDKRIHNSHKIAIFLSFDGEIDTQPIIDTFWKMGKHIYLPAIHPFSPRTLFFLHYTTNTPLMTNQFKIQEPEFDLTHLFLQEQLDILFIPLVAFDEQGNRLGMGGGFYDRTLQKCCSKNRFFPIGIAHDCQKLSYPIPLEKGDIPLPEIITPSHHWRWETNLPPFRKEYHHQSLSRLSYSY